MKKSEITLKYTRLSRMFFWLGVFLTFLPLVIFAIDGMLKGTIDITSKLKMGVCFVAAIILTILGIKSKYNCRSITYILLFGCYFVVKKIEIVILISGFCCIADEFICSPLHKYYHGKAVINKEIDKRINEEWLNDLQQGKK